MGECAFSEPVGYPLAADCLLADAADHLTQVDGRALAAAEGHDQRLVESVQMADTVVSHCLSHFGEGRVEQGFQSLFDGHTWLGLQGAPLIIFHIVVVGCIGLCLNPLVHRLQLIGRSHIADADGHAIVAQPSR